MYRAHAKSIIPVPRDSRGEKGRMILLVVQNAITYPLSVLITLTQLIALFVYTIKASPYSAQSKFAREYVDPLVKYMKTKVLIMVVDIGYASFKRFRANMGKDSNITYFSKHCTVQVRDQGRHYTLYLPYFRSLKREARFQISAVTDKSLGNGEETLSTAKECYERLQKQENVTLTELTTVPGVPIFVSPSEIGANVIVCSKPNGNVLWAFKDNERPVCHITHNRERKGSI